MTVCDGHRDNRALTGIIGCEGRRDSGCQALTKGSTHTWEPIDWVNRQEKGALTVHTEHPDKVHRGSIKKQKNKTKTTLGELRCYTSQSLKTSSASHLCVFFFCFFLSFSHSSLIHLPTDDERGGLHTATIIPHSISTHNALSPDSFLFSLFNHMIVISL